MVTQSLNDADVLALVGEPTLEVVQSSPPSTPSTEEPVKPQDLGKSLSSAVSYPSPTPFDPATPSLQSSLDAQPQLPLPIKNDYDSTASSSQPQPKNTSEVTSRTQSPDPTFHILLVDDNKINRQLLVMFMRKNRFSFLEAENGQEALNIYKAACHVKTPADAGHTSETVSNRPVPTRHDSHLPRRFDFVLMDISMPVMDGMEATRRIREFEQAHGLKKTKVIALTGLASAQAQIDAASAGIDLFLPKPVKFAELRKLLTDES